MWKRLLSQSLMGFGFCGVALMWAPSAAATAGVADELVVNFANNGSLQGNENLIFRSGDDTCTLQLLRSDSSVARARDALWRISSGTSLRLDRETPASLRRQELPGGGTRVVYWLVNEDLAAGEQPSPVLYDEINCEFAKSSVGLSDLRRVVDPWLKVSL